MIEKKIGIFVVILLITIVISSAGLKENICGSEIKLSSSYNAIIEIEDQHNSAEHIDASYGIPLYQGWCLAQGFTPSKQSLSKISLLIGKFGNPSSNTKITVSIKNSLQGDTLASKQVDMSTISTSKVIFDIPDIDVIPEIKYYIVCSADKSSQYSAYYWFYTVNNKYETGDGWLSLDCLNWYNADDAVQFTGIDFGFTTYWVDYGPEDPEIDGPTEGKAQDFTDYTFSTIDPEGNDVRYYIEWGDGIDFKWIGPYESGEIVTKGHSWASEDNYIIRVKAKDIYGAESDWTELKVSMTKTKVTNSPFLTFLENYPNLFPLIRQILRI